MPSPYSRRYRTHFFVNIRCRKMISAFADSYFNLFDVRRVLICNNITRIFVHILCHWMMSVYADPYFNIFLPSLDLLYDPFVSNKFELLDSSHTIQLTSTPIFPNYSASCCKSRAKLRCIWTWYQHSPACSWCCWISKFWDIQRSSVEVSSEGDKQVSVVSSINFKWYDFKDKSLLSSS